MARPDVDNDMTHIAIVAIVAIVQRFFHWTCVGGRGVIVIVVIIIGTGAESR